jgi:uncharacterized protein GlcG (DUF336 family)
MLCAGTTAIAQTPPPPAYGAPIDIATAKKAAAGGVALAAKSGFQMVVAVTDAGGELVYLEKMDNAQSGSVQVAIDKARSAALFRRPTKVFQDIVAGGGDGLRILGLRGAVPIEGGIPIVVGGKIVGAVGTSGGSSAQDGEVAKAAIAALN